MSISVVLPVYNEASEIERCIHHLSEHLPKVTSDFEVIAVNDGSTDKTADLLEGMKQKYNFLKVVHHRQNRGLGGTLRTGFEACTKELMFYTDSDLPVDCCELERAVHVMQMKQADVVTGFRHDRTSEGMIRILYSLVYNIIIRCLFWVAIRDINFSFKLIKTAHLKQMNLQSVGSFIDAEIMIKASRMNLFICQIGVDYFKRKEGGSSLSSPATIFNILYEMCSQIPNLYRIKPL